MVISALKRTPAYELLGYTDPVDRGDLLGVGYMGDDDELARLRARLPVVSAALGLGSIASDVRRESALARLESLGFDLPTIVAPGAIVNEDVALGRGTLILDGVVVNTGCRIGAGVILNTNSTIEHDTEVGDFVHVGPGAVLGGGVRVGKYSLVGSGASVKQLISICQGCTIGIGAAVVSDCECPGVYVGVPARIRR